MSKNDKLTIKEMNFIDAYIRSGGNGLQSYLEAGYKAKNDNVAGVGAFNLLKKPNVSTELDNRLTQIKKDNEITQQEVLDFFSSVMRGQEVNSNQLKAGELLGKTFKMFTDRIETSGNVDIQINFEATDAEEESLTQLEE